MGNCISCISGLSNQVAAPTPEQEPKPIPHPYPNQSNIGHLIDGDASFLASNVSRNSWYSMASTNFSTWISQVSEAVAAMWGDDNELLVGIDDGPLPDGATAIDPQLRAFMFEELEHATFNFKKGMLLGKGGFGCVYKGWLKEKVPSRGIRRHRIAVKRLDKNSKQGFRQWQTEVGFLARLSHPDIVKLMGYCREKEELLIVYEYMEKGCLNYHLFGKGLKQILSWGTRVKIVVGMARALSYLHRLEKPTIFRDFKSSNVLLDQTLAWQNGDLKMIPRAKVVGTAGYVDPYYVATGDLNVKSDVYSFGVVLVEILTGLRAIDKNLSFEKLVDWAKPQLYEKHKLKRIMDHKMEGKYSIEQASEIAIVAVRCLNSFRPSMLEVLETLVKIEARYH